MKLGQQLREMSQAARLRLRTPPEPPEKVPLDDEQAVFLTDGWYEQITKEAQRRASAGCTTMRFELGRCDTSDGEWYRRMAANLTRRLQEQDVRVTWSQHSVERHEDECVTHVGYETSLELNWV